MPPAANEAATLAGFPGPVRLYADKRLAQYLCGMFAVMAFLIGKALFFGADRQHSTAQLILFIALLWPIGVTAAIVLSRNALALDLDRDCFTINAYAWYRPRRCSWNDAGDFGTRSFRFMTFAAWQDRAAGRQRLIPDTYGLGAEALARLMTQWQQRALARQA